MHGTSWQDQWMRILRWHTRVERGRDEPRNDAEGTEGYRDEVFALYQAIWHLKDWFKNDLATQAGAGSAVETWVTSASARRLLIAADVANGSKHMSLHTTRSDGSQQTRNDVTVVVGAGAKHTFYVQDKSPGGQEYEAVDLADLCLSEWRTFIAAQGLKLP